MIQNLLCSAPLPLSLTRNKRNVTTMECKVITDMPYLDNLSLIVSEPLV